MRRFWPHGLTIVDLQWNNSVYRRRQTFKDSNHNLITCNSAPEASAEANPAPPNDLSKDGRPLPLTVQKLIQISWKQGLPSCAGMSPTGSQLRLYLVTHAELLQIHGQTVVCKTGGEPAEEDRWTSDGQVTKKTGGQTECDFSPDGDQTDGDASHPCRPQKVVRRK